MKSSTAHPWDITGARWSNDPDDHPESARFWSPIKIFCSLWRKANHLLGSHTPRRCHGELGVAFWLDTCESWTDVTVSPCPGLCKEEHVAWAVSSEAWYSARIRIWNQIKLSHREPLLLIVNEIPRPDSLEYWRRPQWSQQIHDHRNSLGISSTLFEVFSFWKGILHCRKRRHLLLPAHSFYYSKTFKLYVSQNSTSCR